MKIHMDKFGGYLSHVVFKSQKVQIEKIIGKLERKNLFKEYFPNDNSLKDNLLVISVWPTKPTDNFSTRTEGFEKFWPKLKPTDRLAEIFSIIPGIFSLPENFA